MNEPIDLHDRLALKGKAPGGAAKALRPSRAGRVCTDEGCRTILSVYNPADRCWAHTQPAPYLLNVRRFRTSRVPA